MTSAEPPPALRTGLRSSITTAQRAFSLVSAAARRELRLTIGLTVLGALFTAGELLVGRKLVDLLVDDAEVGASDLMPWLIALAVLLIGTALVNTGVAELRILMHDLVHRQAMDEVLETATASELEQFDDPEFHDQLQRARDHADANAWQVVWGLVTLASTTFSSIAVMIVLLGIAPVLVPIALIALVPIAMVSVVNTRALYRMRYEMTEVDRDRLYHERLLTGRVEAKEVRAFGLGEWLRRRHDELFAERIANTRRVVARRTWVALGGSTVTSLVLIGALAAVFALALDDRISVGDAAVAIVALQQLGTRLRGVGDALTSMYEGVTFLRDFETFRVATPFVVHPAATTPPVHPERITVDHLQYRYPAGTDYALLDISFELTPGRVLAVVGPNGAGKSTLAKLLCGLLPAQPGAIRWDDVDVDECDPAAVRALVAPVFQDFTRYEHTAREAIGFGDLEHLDDRSAIVDAARVAGAADFIARLSNGYDTRLSTSFSGGADLSVGQWQRIAIARAFFRDAPLVVMDEPAAALDPRAERDLFEHLHALGKDRMVVFISHRFATVRRADHIIVLLDGRIAEQGSHDDLLALDGLYAELYQIQAEQFG